MAQANAIAYIGDPADAGEWRRCLSEKLGPIDWRVWPELGRGADIEIALCWGPPAGLWAQLPNLKLIVSLGMGVDHLFRHGRPPADIPIVRINDPGLIDAMAEYVLLHVLRIHRDDDAYLTQQRAGLWRPLPPTLAKDRAIGIMGMGAIGQFIAAKLVGLGFTVAGWARTAKKVPGSEAFAGPDQMAEFLGRSQILVNVLALTESTRGIVNAKTLSLLPRGAHFINVARGGHVVDADLLAALDSGQLASAVLDVTAPEPLPAGHPYWNHPKVRITPHVAGPTFPASSAPGVIDNILRLREGRDLVDRIDPARGY